MEYLKPIYLNVAMMILANEIIIGRYILSFHLYKTSGFSFINSSERQVGQILTSSFCCGCGCGCIGVFDIFGVFICAPHCSVASPLPATRGLTAEQAAPTEKLNLKSVKSLNREITKFC